MKKLLAKLTGRAVEPRARVIRNAPSGSIVRARHEITSELGLARTVPAGTRGILQVSIYRDPKAMVIVDWDGIGNSNAQVADLSPHFEGAPAATPASSTPVQRNRASDDLSAAVRAATTSTAQPGSAASPGRLVFHVFAALAEFERDLIRERTHAGLAVAGAAERTPRASASC